MTEFIKELDVLIHLDLQKILYFALLIYHIHHKEYLCAITTISLFVWEYYTIFKGLFP